MLCLTLRIRTVQCLCLIFHLYLCRTATDRTDLRDIFYTASGQIFCNLRNDHVGFIHLNDISYAKLQIFHNADIMHTGTAYRSSFQLYRFKDRYRIDQACP